jgi:hypothetical protein
MSRNATSDPDQEQVRAAPEAAAPEARLTAAVKLGWRVAELYAQVDDTAEPSGDTLLPGHGSLDRRDQLELQLRAAAGDARRAGIDPDAEALDQLAAAARKAPSSDAAATAFRARVRKCHVELSKDLWAEDEAAGRAYELGNGISDTYGRICRAYRDGEDPRGTWESVFASDRIERLKKLLDDLQSRLNNRGAVAVVRQHLDEWRDGVGGRIIDADAAPPPLGAVRDGLRRQTVIWRQLLAGDKAPEAYLDGDARAAVRGKLRELVWARCRRWLVPVALVLFALVAFVPQILDWYEESTIGTTIASAAVALTGAFGITKASVLMTVRTRAQQWSELLWSRALVEEVSDVTLELDSVIEEPEPDAGSFVATATRVGAGVKQRLAARSGPVSARVPRTGL